MKKQALYLIAITLFIATFSSCYKEESFSTDDYDLTVTNFDKNFDFKTYKTYYLRDSVGLISDYIDKGNLAWNRFYSKGGTSDQIRNSVRRHFDQLGYTEIMDSLQDADFAVNMVVTLNKVQGYMYYPGYWFGYPGYWDGYYGGGSDFYWDAGYYPWYGGYSYSYKTGNLMLEMADGDSLRAFIHYLKITPDPSPKDPNAPKLKYVWSSFIDGLQGDQTGVDRLLSGIDEAFDNSPYLNRN